MSDLAKLFDTDPATRGAFELCKLAFERFAGLKLEDPMPEHEVDAMQVALARWQNEKYGPNPDSLMALGMIEEGTETFTADENTEEALDGLGDTCVYAAQLATNNRLAIAPIIDLARVFTQRQDIRPILGAGVLSQVVLKGSQKIRGLDQVERYRLRLVGAMAMVIAKAIDDVEILHPQTSPVKAGKVLCVVGGEVLQRAAGHPSIPQQHPIVIDAVIGATTHVQSKDQRDNEAMAGLQQAAALLEKTDEEIKVDGIPGDARMPGTSEG